MIHRSIVPTLRVDGGARTTCPVAPITYATKRVLPLRHVVGATRCVARWILMMSIEMKDACGAITIDGEARAPRGPRLFTGLYRPGASARGDIVLLHGYDDHCG